jgi:hypothetical protein
MRIKRSNLIINAEKNMNYIYDGHEAFFLFYLAALLVNVPFLLRRLNAGVQDPKLAPSS